MALATQCPHCHTTFKVAHDQLKLRSGLVRCGSCKQIFNGIENLVPPDQPNAGANASAQEKPKPAPTLAAPPAPSSPTAPELDLPPAATAPRATRAPEQAAPSTPPSPGQSAINALEFVPVDDPETRTRILDAETDLSETPAANRPQALDSAPVDEDPLTRMTLVDFSVFDEDLAEAAIEPATEQSPTAQQHSEEIWPDTQEQIEQQTSSEAAKPGEPATPGESDEPSPVPMPLDDAGATPLAVGDEAAGNEAVDDNAAAPEELVSAPAADINPGAIDEQEYGEAASAEPVLAAEDDADEPDFVISERRRQRRRKIQRIIMAIGSVLLLAALLVQAAYVFRSQLAARFPQSRPLLSQLCDVAACQILLPAQIEQVSIESNELQMQEASKNVFTLSLLLHNRSTVPQAWPYIELTLNDKDGKALVRRVLTPKEYLSADKRSAEGIPARSEEPVNVSFELNQLQASDYRVYLFYP